MDPVGGFLSEFCWLRLYSFPLFFFAEAKLLNTDGTLELVDYLKSVLPFLVVLGWLSRALVHLMSANASYLLIR